jgi:hypothetical protein
MQRCPQCGRTWDGVACFACGHEAPRDNPFVVVPAAASPSPSPTPSSLPRGQTPRPPPHVVPGPLEDFTTDGPMDAPTISPLDAPTHVVTPAPVGRPTLPRTASRTLPTAPPRPRIVGTGMVQPAPSRPAWQMPALFGGAFAIAVVVAVVLMSRDSPADLFRAGKFEKALVLLQKQKTLGGPDLFLKGHIHRALGDSSAMAQSFHAALATGATDVTAVASTIALLGDPGAAHLARPLLDGWPNVDEALLDATKSAKHNLRNEAVRVLLSRGKLAGADLVRAEVNVALLDINDGACATKALGFAAIGKLASRAEASTALRASRAFQAVLVWNSDAAVADQPCLQRASIESLTQRLAALSDR